MTRTDLEDLTQLKITDKEWAIYTLIHNATGFSWFDLASMLTKEIEHNPEGLIAYLHSLQRADTLRLINERWDYYDSLLGYVDEKGHFQTIFDEQMKAREAKGETLEVCTYTQYLAAHPNAQKFNSRDMELAAADETTTTPPLKTL